ncbi:MAG: Gfo/Idh/MocA family oxidoreductase [Methanolinea sp.]|nr:Gfo/Idh/MocA family oxidoreductase [Methanolinea sp.]
MDVGVIGVGVMGRNHVRVYSELKQAGEVYVYDRDGDATRDVALAYEVTPCPTVKELLGKVDAVSVCVPTPFHRAVGEEVLAAGVHMLMEKPLCATAAEARELMEKGGDGQVVGVGHIERFNPIVAEVQRIIRDPVFIEMNRHNPASLRPMGSSVIEDLMIHDLDILLHVLLGEGYELSAAGNLDAASALFRYDGTAAFVSASRKASKKIRRIYIEEDDFTLEGDFMNQEVFTYYRPEQYGIENERYVQENIIEKVMVNKVEPLKLELATFLDCARKGTPFPVTMEQAARDLVLCEQVRALIGGR